MRARDSGPNLQADNPYTGVFKSRLTKAQGLAHPPRTPQQYSAGSCNQQRTPMDYAQPERLPGHAFIGADGGPGKERSCAWKAACYNTFAQRTLGVTLPTLPTLVGPTLDHIFLARPTLATHHHPAHPGACRPSQRAHQELAHGQSPAQAVGPSRVQLTSIIPIRLSPIPAAPRRGEQF